MRRRTRTTPSKILLFQLLPILFSLQNAVSFVPYSVPTSRRVHSIFSHVPFRERRRQWRVRLCSTSDDDDDDFDDDGEEVEYGKFEKESKMHRQEEEEDDGSLQPLPDFLKDDGDGTSSPSSPPSLLDETQRRIEQQQQQIDTLMKLVQQQTQQQPQLRQFNQLSETPPITTLPPQQPSDSSQHTVTAATTPLKAMLFIDGTWLYYSIHERSELRCPIVKKYGRGWQTRYQVDWPALIRVIAQELQKQQDVWNVGGSSSIEISRASVYTSCKKETSVYSNRIKMFEEMKQNNFDVFMMETVGPGEKCVDIQLAVEMLHYATVLNAYDIAILLSGDKDFLPALIRTRQKGRKVALVSMKTGCNRALYETPNVKDYDVVWIDDFLDQLIIPRENVPDAEVSIFTLSKAIYDFIRESGLPRVSSRDIGRYLKQIKTPKGSFLDVIKQSYGGLYQFLNVSGCFDVLRQNPRDEMLARQIDPLDKTFWTAIHPDAERTLLEEAKQASLNSFEKEFFDTYSLSELIDDQAYFGSKQMLNVQNEGEQYSDSTPFILPEELKKDFSSLKVAELKEECRERGLPVSGTKAVLVERIQADVDEQIAELERQHKAKTRINASQSFGIINGEGRGGPPPARPQSFLRVPPETEQYLEDLVKEYLRASGGQAGSRDIGRYLATSADSTGRDGSVSPGQQGRKTALSELKELYGGLNSFIRSRQDSFEKFEDSAAATTAYEFQVALRE